MSSQEFRKMRKEIIEMYKNLTGLDRLDVEMLLPLAGTVITDLGYCED